MFSYYIMSLVNPQLQVFSEPLEDASIEGYDYHNYAPDTEVPGVGQSRWDIQIKDLDSYINFSRSYLQVSVRLVTAAGAAIAAAKDCALVNNGLSLFETARILVDGQIIEETNFCPQATTMRFLAESSDDYYRTSGSAMGFYKDTGTGSNVPANNAGFTTRRAIADNGKNMTMYIPIKHLFGYACVDKITKGLRHTLSLTKSSRANMIHQNTGNAGAQLATGTDVYFSKIRLWTPVCRPSLSVISSIEGKLNQGFSQKMNWLANNSYRSGEFAAANTTINWRIANAAVNPKTVFVAFQLVSKDNDETESPVVFSHENVTEIELRVNSQAVPKERLQVDYAAATVDAARAYHMFNQHANQFNDNQNGSLVNYTDYSSGLYAIYRFDLGHIDPAVFAVSGSADLELRVRKTASAGNIRIFANVLGEREAVISGASNSLRLEML
jgi:hypothetical protein